MSPIPVRVNMEISKFEFEQVGVLLAAVNSAANPFVYALLMPVYRRNVLRMLRQPCNPSTSSSSSPASPQSAVSSVATTRLQMPPDEHEISPNVSQIDAV